MPISESKKQSDLEKRLKLLRQQVYGKNLAVSDTPIHSPRFAGKAGQSSGTPVSSGLSDISYLYQDLTKIFILATSAFAIQLTLFFLMQKHLINLSF